MKVLVAYMSQTGNTKKVAEAIFEEINDAKEIKRIEAIDNIADCDIAFLGFPIHGEGPDKKEQRILQKLCTNGRNVALFITHASPEGVANQELQQWLDKFREAARGANLVDLFDCQGQLARTIKMFMSIMPNAKYRMWARMDNSQGQPDEAGLHRARAFARDVMMRVYDNERRTGRKEQLVLV